MARTGDFTDALRGASLSLLAVSLLAGPLGLGFSGASAAQKTCGVSCPCDEEEHGEDAHAEEAHAEEAHADDGCDRSHEVPCGADAPCDDTCPDDCPECSCCAGLMVGLAPAPVPILLGAISFAKRFDSPDVPKNGDASGIFRPPRPGT